MDIILCLFLYKDLVKTSQVSTTWRELSHVLLEYFNSYV